MWNSEVIILCHVIGELFPADLWLSLRTYRMCAALFMNIQYLHLSCSNINADLQRNSSVRVNNVSLSIKLSLASFTFRWSTILSCPPLRPKYTSTTLLLRGHAVALTDPFIFMVLRRLWVLQSNNKKKDGGPNSVDYRICIKVACLTFFCLDFF